MAKFNEKLLKRLCETPGIPSREEQMREVVAAELRSLVDEVTVNALGNLTGRRSGAGGPKVMIAAHMDEIGFFVSHIDDNGFVRFQTVGGFDSRALVAQRAVLHGFDGKTYRGAIQFPGKPIHVLEPSEIKVPGLDELFIDIGMDAAAVRERIEVGDMITLDRTLERVGDCVMSKSLDDRVGIFVMIEALRRAPKTSAEIYAVATTQEEVGLRGARTSAYWIKPDISIALDVTLAMDIPESKAHHQVTRMREGAAIKIMDSSVLSHPGVVRHFRDIAKKHKIPNQLEILPRGGTDAGATQQSRGGNAAITLSIPTRYIHTVNELAAVSDIDACIELLARYLEEAGSRDYAFKV